MRVVRRDNVRPPGPGAAVAMAFAHGFAGHIRGSSPLPLGATGRCPSLSTPDEAFDAISAHLWEG
ncbi:hypothetical protein [Dactylosporangium sp. NPDC051484]|uniref:hypothetical protein n=1 Tax=Dactylosporangium sp. NPDC051484 TaxID=3154942 RepID=UPI00344D6B5C